MEKMKNELLKDISEYLNIQRYVGEMEQSYINRLLYSAVGETVMVSSLKKSPKQLVEGVSKTYINLKNSKYLESLWSIFPAFKNYFKNVSSTDAIKKIRIDYELAGWLRSSSFGEFVEVAPIVFSKLENGYCYSRNNLASKKRVACGLGFYEEIEPLDQKTVSINKLFDSNEISAIEWTKKYIQKLKWQNAEQLNNDTGVLFFNPRVNKSLSYCWSHEFPQNVRITVYKKNDFDYGFVKKSDDKIVGIYIPSFYINASNPSNNMIGGNVRRFMYGLKALYKNNAKVKLVSHEKHTIIKLFNKLPVRETMIMRMCGWPVKNYEDDLEFIVPNDLVTVCMHVIENLAIKIM